MNFLRKAIDEGELMPNGYGVAYVDYCRRQAVCYPIGLNAVIGVCRAIYFWLCFDYRKSPFFGAEAYYQGLCDRKNPP